MLPSILEQISHFQRHGAIRAQRRPLTPDQLPCRLDEIARRWQEARQALNQPEPGWLQLHPGGWERFATRQRCLQLEYGRYQDDSGRLLEVRIAPDGTALLRVTNIDLLAPENAFQQRLYCPAPRQPPLSPPPPPRLALTAAA